MTTEAAKAARPLVGRVVVVGGGITGLTAAYALQEQVSKGSETGGPGMHILLVEAEHRLGGKIRTERFDGYQIEAGPDSIFAVKPWALELAGRLGMADRVVGANPERRQSFILRDGRLLPMPEGLYSLVPTRFIPFVTSRLISVPGKLRMAMDYFIPPRREGGDESLASFITRRLGREALDYLAEPLLAGIHAADTTQLSLEASFPQFRRMELEHGSLLRAMLAQRRKAARSSQASQSSQTQAASGRPWQPPGSGGQGRPRRAGSPFLTFREGQEELVHRLAGALSRVEVIRGRRVVGLSAGPPFRLALDSGEQLEADGVALATPAFATAELVAPLSPEAADRLRGIGYTSVATVALAFDRSGFGHPLNGSGFVVPPREGRAITACTWVSSKWPGSAPEDRVLLRCYLGRAGDEAPLEATDEQIAATALEEVQAILGVRARPLMQRVYRWPQAMPQYTVGHLERLSAIEEALSPFPGLVLAGAGYRGIGIPDCVRQGNEAAARLLRELGVLPH